jgi:uncharacterized protein (DUF362 family)
MLSRRKFFKSIAVGGIGAAVLTPSLQNNIFAKLLPDEKPATNVKDLEKYPRTENSMPGKYPGRVVMVKDDKSIVDNKFNQSEIDKMVSEGMIKLTGEKDINKAWLKLVKPGEVIGLKVNPIGGAQLSTSLEIVTAVIAQLTVAGIPKKDIVIWDRREFELHEAGFTEDKFPGIKITGTERKDKDGSFYNKEGKLYSEEMIDKEWYYWADVEGKYDAETMPYMVNEGKYSYFTKICTKEVDKIINMPIMKNAGASITMCMKNLGYGVITNTGRLHKDLWSETTAEVCAFPPVRDKVVLNIADGIKGCYNGGPGVDPKFVTEYKTVLIGTDPVAVDRVGYDIIYKKRVEEKIQKEESPKGRKFLELAEKLKLGVADLSKITIETVNL